MNKNIKKELDLTNFGFDEKISNELNEIKLTDKLRNKIKEYYSDFNKSL